MDFKVHRVVLGPKSPVFMAAMDKEGPMLIRDVDSGTLQVCLILYPTSTSKVLRSCSSQVVNERLMRSIAGLQTGFTDKIDSLIKLPFSIL